MICVVEEMEWEGEEPEMIELIQKEDKESNYRGKGFEIKWEVLDIHH